MTLILINKIKTFLMSPLDFILKWDWFSLINRALITGRLNLILLYNTGLILFQPRWVVVESCQFIGSLRTSFERIQHCTWLLVLFEVANVIIQTSLVYRNRLSWRNQRSENGVLLFASLKFGFEFIQKPLILLNFFLWKHARVL